MGITVPEALADLERAVRVFLGSSVTEDMAEYGHIPALDRVQRAISDLDDARALERVTAKPEEPA